MLYFLSSEVYLGHVLLHTDSLIVWDYMYEAFCHVL